MRPSMIPRGLLALLFIITLTGITTGFPGSEAFTAPGAPPAAARARDPRPDQACEVRATRDYGGADKIAVAWGDEVSVDVVVTVNCPAGRVARVEITEALPAEIGRVGGIGRAPDATRGAALTWRFENPPVAPATLRFSYRVYVTPPWSGFDAEGEQTLGWPMLIDVTEAGALRREPVPDHAPIRVRERRNLGCGMARAREILPPQVLAGQAFDVRLRLTLTGCSPFARRSRGIIALQPYTDAASMLQLAQVNTALLDPARVTAANAMFGAVVNESGGPRIQPPTSEFIFVEDLVRGLAPDPAGGGDAAAALRAALDLVPDWPMHFELIVYITHPAAPRADPASLRAIRDEAASRGVEIVAICVGGGCDPGLDYAYTPADLRVLRRDVMQGLLQGHRGPPLELQAIEVEERLLRFVQVEPDSLGPAGQWVGGNILHWRIAAPVPGTPIEIGYRARIDIWGRLPLGLGGTARVIDADGGRQSFDLPKGVVLVDRDPDAAPRPCRPAVAKSAAPRRVPLGDPVTIQLDFGAECPGEETVVDVMLVLDVSGSMEGQKIQDARDAALAFLDVLPPGPARVGLVTFDHRIMGRVPLSVDYAPLRSELAAMVADGGTDIAAGIAAATEELRGRRAGATAVMIVMTDGFNNNGPIPMIEAAADAKKEGNALMSICFGGADSCDPDLVNVASLPALHFNADSSDALIRQFVDLGLLLRQLGLASARVVDVLPPHMRYVPGSAVPPPTEIRPAAPPQGQALVWDFTEPPLGGVAMRYQAEPLLLGPQVTNAEASVSFVDDRNRPGAAVFPVPVVETYIPDPEGPCTPALGKVADRARAEVGAAVGVTLDIRMDCPKRVAPLDIVLVVDHSASMGALGRLDNAKLAAGAFLDALDPAVTRVGLVAFSDDVSRDTALTHDFGQIRRAVDLLRPAGQTGISQALNAARTLLNQRRPEALGAVILLTDGANTAGPEPMLASAQRLKDTGAILVTVCAGSCDTALPLAASRPAYAFNVQASAGLVDLFRHLAEELTVDQPHDLLVTDSFPAAVAVDPASMAPPPSDATADQAIWRFDRLPETGLRLRYSVRPLVPGRVPANRFARLDYRFGLGQSGRAFFPVPVIEVDGGATPTATLTPTLTATAGPGPSATAAIGTAGTPTAGTPHASATPDAPRERIYLPYGVRE